MTSSNALAKDGFVFEDEHLYAEVSHQNRHRRANVSGLKRILLPPKDRAAHWYEAQLIHYGLPPTKDKATAKLRLVDALRNGDLAVPIDLQILEAELKLESLKNKKLMANVDRGTKSTPPAGVKLKGKPKNATTGNAPISKTATKKEKSSVSSERKDIPTLTAQLSQREKLDRGLRMLGLGSIDDYEIEEPDFTSTKADVVGSYILMSDIEGEWPDEDDFKHKLDIFSSGGKMWGSFDIDYFQGVMLIEEVTPRIERNLIGVGLLWRCRDENDMVISYGVEDQEGSFSLDMETKTVSGRFRGLYQDIEFEGKPDPHAPRGPLAVGEDVDDPDQCQYLEQQWEELFWSNE